jgi:outer membrane protein TolC
MGIAEIIALATGALTFGKSLIPQIRDMFASGEVSAADQAKVRAAYDSLRKQAGGEFTGPEWELSGR